MISEIHGLALCAALFSIGLVGVLARRNLLFMLLSVEIMMNAAALAFIIAGSKWGQPDGQVTFLFILAIAAVEVTIGLGLAIQLYGSFKTLDTDRMSTMRG